MTAIRPDAVRSIAICSLSEPNSIISPHSVRENGTHSLSKNLHGKWNIFNLSSLRCQRKRREVLELLVVQASPTLVCYPPPHSSLESVAPPPKCFPPPPPKLKMFLPTAMHGGSLSGEMFMCLAAFQASKPLWGPSSWMSQCPLPSGLVRRRLLWPNHELSFWGDWTKRWLQGKKRERSGSLACGRFVCVSAHATCAETGFQHCGLICDQTTALNQLGHCLEWSQVTKWHAPCIRWDHGHTDFLSSSPDKKTVNYPIFVEQVARYLTRPPVRLDAPWFPCTNIRCL